MSEFNLLKSVPTITRDVSERLVNKAENVSIASKFAQEYFDGPRSQGYGGYKYDGRWKSVAATASSRYNLCSGLNILDVGCAKGFFLFDLISLHPGLNAYGLDISDYAIQHAPAEVKQNLVLGSADKLPFEDHFFDAVFSINTIHNLDRDGCVRSLKEMVRVVKDPRNCFVQVDAYRTPKDKSHFENWMLTAKTYCTPEEWLNIFSDAGYVGDYFWTILDVDSSKSQGASE